MIPSTRSLDAWKSVVKPGQRYRVISSVDRASLWTPKTYRFNDGESSILTFVKYVDRGQTVICVGEPFLVGGKKSIGVPVSLDSSPGEVLVLLDEHDSSPFNLLQEI